MSSSATPTYGVKVRIKIAGAYQDIAELIRVPIPKRSRKAIEVTNSDSASAVAEYIKSKIKRLEAFTIGVNHDPSDPTQDNSTGLGAAVESDDAVDIQFYWPSPIGRTLSFAALALSEDIKGDYPEGSWQADYEIQPTGAYTWASAA